MTAPKTNFATKVAKALLKLVARKKWRNITLDLIAKTAKVPLKQVHQTYPTTEDILPAIVRYIDRESTKNINPANPKTTLNERLFEIIMMRFDTLQVHRKSMISLTKETRTHVQIAKILFPYLMASMQHMLCQANVPQDKASNKLCQLALLGIYQLAIIQWEKDNSRDLSATMAALDKYLRLAVGLGWNDPKEHQH